jgi:hypothetical protein
MLSQVYHDFVQTRDLGGARREFQNSRESEGKSLFVFSWLYTCADRDAWREFIGYILASSVLVSHPVGMGACQLIGTLIL